jgi:hypothetical protein
MSIKGTNLPGAMCSSLRGRRNHRIRAMDRRGRLRAAGIDNPAGIPASTINTSIQASLIPSSTHYGAFITLLKFNAKWSRTDLLRASRC